MSKSNKDANATGFVGTLEATKEEFLKESSGTKVQNPNQNKEIHKEALGRNAHR